MRQRVRGALASSGLVPSEGRVLLAHVLNRDRSWLIAHSDDELTPAQAKAFEALTRRRHNGAPIAYLTGRREFYGLDLEVSPAVLIPRPETELLVELALEHIGEGDSARVLDLGSGSGAIALAIAHRRPRCSVVGVDVSVEALATARSNAQRLNVSNVTFVESDWFDNVPRDGFALIVSNPPYVANDDTHLAQGDLRFEPPGALKGGVDGLAAIRKIVAGAGGFLAPGGWLLIEHGYNQAESVQALLVETGYSSLESRRDLAGILRVTFGRR
ncbi:MAG: peptide chain release factor N(5)-glutamine methyltransferase [Casimicrobiaceae bacterium]